MAKRGKAPDSGSIQSILSSKRSSTSNAWSFWALGAVLIALVAWSSLRQEESSQASKGTEVNGGEERDERLDAIREALFSEDGGYAFARDKETAQGTKNRTRMGFSEAEYWEKRYSQSKQEHYDWYGTWNSQSKIRIKPHVLPWMPAKVENILNIGCGNSRLAEELVNDGYTDIVSVDIAQAAIDRMNEKFKGVAGLRFMQMDATNMTFEDESFDVVFDKGTLDAMYTGAAQLVKLAVAQVFRVLRPGGLLVSLTFGHPNSRKDLNWTSGVEGGATGWDQFETKKIFKEDDGLPDKQTFWMYLMRKPL